MLDRSGKQKQWIRRDQSSMPYGAFVVGFTPIIISQAMFPLWLKFHENSILVVTSL